MVFREYFEIAWEFAVDPASDSGCGLILAFVAVLSCDLFAFRLGE